MFRIILSFLVALSLPASAASGLFLKTPPAANAFLLKFSGDTLDSRATSYALQGLVNQTSAEVFIDERGNDRSQINFSGKPYTVLNVATVGGSTSLRGVRTLFVKYQASVQKMFIYDATKDWTYYLALMASAQQNGIPVTTTVRDALRAQVPGWAGTEVDYSAIGTTRVEGYTWALTNLMPNCTKQSVYFARAFDLDCIDYVVASKSFVFNLLVRDVTDPDYDPAQVAMVNQIFSTPGYGVGTSLGGYAGDSVNRLANPYGIGYNVSDFYSNGSFWSSFPNKTYTQATGQAITAQNGKVYVAILLSDGDNLQFDQGAMYSNWKNDINRGTVPVGTSLSPVLQEIDTPLLDWYYANKTANDELIAGPCGFQFIYLNDYDPAQLPEWCEINAKWTADAGFHTASVWVGTFPSANYDTYTAISGVDNIRHNSNLFSLSTNPRFSNGVPVFNERIRDCQTEQELYEDLAGVDTNAGAPVFATGKLITARFGNTIFTSVKTVVDRLNTDFPNKYVFQLPRDQAETAREHLQPKRIWNTGNGTWDTSTANWVKKVNGASVADTYTNNVDAVAFEDASGVTGNPVITLNSAYTPEHVSMKSTLRDYTISGSGGIGGTTALILDPANTGTLTLACSNTYTGVTAINGGTLRIGNSGTTGSLATTSIITNNSAMVFNRSNAITQGTHFATAISGSGTLANTGTGTLTLNAANTYRGATTISNGVLILGNSLAMQNSPLDTLNSIAGGLRTTATALTLGGLTGNKNLASVFTPTTGGYAGLTALTLNPASGANLNYSADIGNGIGSMNLIKTGLGTQILSGTNTHTGSTSIHNGVLKSGVDNTLPTATAVSLGSGATVGGLDLDTFNQTVATLNVNSDSTSLNNTLAIGAGKTLTVTGNFIVGFNSAANTTSKLAPTGLGTLTVTTGNLQVGGSITNGFGSAATLDMSGLGNFTFDNSAGTFRVGDSAGNGVGTGSSTLTLADTSTITASTLTTDSPSSQPQFIRLGSVTNTINAITVNIGLVGNRTSGGSLNFNDTTGNLTIRGNAGGTTRANMNVGYGGASTATSSLANSVDLAGHFSDLRLGTLQIGGRTGIGGSTTATFSFDTGPLDATAVTVGLRGASTSGNAGPVDGTLNLGGGTVTIGATGLSVGRNSSTLAANTVNGTVNISGGTVNIGNTTTSITLGSNSGAGGTGGATTATLNLTGGTLTVAGNIIKGTATGPLTSTLKLSGGTLDMGGKNIGATGAGAITFTAESGEFRNVAAINDTGGLTKTTAGTLVLSGTNNYLGATTVNGGILSISSDANLGTVPASTTPGNIVLDGGTLRTTNVFTINSKRGITLGASGGTINNAVDGNLIYNGIIAGTSGGALTVTHAGSSGGDLAVGTFAAANTYDGATIIDNGHLSVNNLLNGGIVSSIGLSSNAAANLVLKNTAVLHYQGGAAPAVTTDRLFTLGTGDNELRSSGSGGITFGNTGGLAYTDSGIRTLSLRAVTAATTNTLASIIGDGTGGATSLHKHGPGTWRLTGANTYTGETRINGGILALDTGGSLGNGNHAGAILIGDGASLSAATTLPQILSGVITGAGTLRQNGPAEITLTGANTFTGATTISSGVLTLSNSLALQNSPLDTLNSIVGNSTTGLKTTMTALTLGGLTGNKNLVDLFTTTGGYSGLTTLILNPSIGISHSYSGDIGNGNGSLSLIKTGLGTQVLSGTNTYGGSTTIGQGTLAFAAANTSLTGVLTFGATDGSTTTGALDLSAGSATFGGLVVRTDSAANNTISIGTGKTLTVAGNFTVGFDSAANTTTKLTPTGLGTLSVTTGNFQVGGSITSDFGSAATLDMSGLANFSYMNSTGTFRVGDFTNSSGGGTGSSTLILADTSIITATSLSTNSPTARRQYIKLGGVENTINATTISIGLVGGRSTGGTLEFNETTGNLTIRGTAGGSTRANMTVGYGNSTTGTISTFNIVDLTGASHSADLLLNNLQIGGRTNGTSSGGTTAIFSFENGALDATSVAVGLRAGTAGTATGAVNATLNLGGGTVTIGAAGLTVASNSSSFVGNTVNGTVNITGGAVNIGNTTTSITLGNNSNASNGGTTAALNIAGGSLTVAGAIIKGSTAGTLTSTLTLSGGTLDMGGNRIGVTGAGAIALIAESGELKNVLSINSSGGLSKTTAGVLTISGTNTYAGATTISEGTLALGASNALPATAISIGSATLNATTFTDTIGTLDATGSAVINLGAGASLAFANSSAIDWTGGTLNLTGTFVSGSSLRFGTSNTALTSTQLGKISATGFTGFVLNATGYLTANIVFSKWIVGSFTNGQEVPVDQQGPYDDFDNDGIPNLIEFAIAGQDPTVANATVGSFTGTTLSFTKRAGTSGLSYAIEKSTDLGILDVWAEPPAGGFYVNSATTISYTLTPTAPAKNFLRLRVLSN